jgi:hypothetical protein
MNKQNNISEDEKFKIHVDKKTLNDPSKTKELASLQKTNKNIEFDLETSTSSSSSSSSMANMQETAGVEPEPIPDIKYLSNVVDANTGDVSKPFTISDKRYQMVRGTMPSGDVVLAVYSHDDLNDRDENMIYPVDYFEENIALPMKEMLEKKSKKDDLLEYLNMADLKEYRHFFVNTESGDMLGKFKTTKEMFRSGIKLGPNEDYMNAKQLKEFRAQKHFAEKLNSKFSDEEGIDEEIDTNKLKGDVKVLIDKMSRMFGKYFSKLNTPVEQGVFLVKMAEIVGVPSEKLSQIVSSVKDVAKDDTDSQAPTGTTPSPTTESKIITKKELSESISPKKILKTVKVKNIK